MKPRRLFSLLVIFAPLLLASCTGATDPVRTSGIRTNTTAQPSEIKEKNARSDDSIAIASRQSGVSTKLAATLYYAAREQDYDTGNPVPFRDVNGETLHMGSAAFKKAASIEGTAIFTDGTVLNYHKRIGGEVRWIRIRSKLGLDARGCPLVPFRSAAVDPSVIKLGSRLEISETVGMRLPDGGRHDGVWYAADTGDGIDGHRIDLFTGLGADSMKAVERHGIGHLQKLTVTTFPHPARC